MKDNKKCDGCDCLKKGKDQTTCRQYIDYPEDDNCVLISVRKHGNLTLREIGLRLGISFVRVKHIEEAALAKLRRLVKRKKLDKGFGNE